MVELSCLFYCPQQVLNSSPNNPLIHIVVEKYCKTLASKLWQNIVSCSHHFNMYLNSSWRQVAFQRFQSICRKQRRCFCKQQQRSLGITWQHGCCRWSHHLVLKEWKRSGWRAFCRQTWNAHDKMRKSWPARNLIRCSHRLSSLISFPRTGQNNPQSIIQQLSA